MAARSAAQSPSDPPLASRRSLALLCALAALWTALAWFTVERLLQIRIAALIAQETNEVRQVIGTISTNVDRVYNRLQGVAAVLAAGNDARTVLATFGPGAGPSPVSYGARKTQWTRRPDLLVMSRLLHESAENIGVDIIWLMNAGGDCVAASNAAGPQSFVGTNYADRGYFTSAQAGQRGRQYAVGRITRVPGLFFSAPVMADGRFLGAVAVKSDLSRIVSAVNHPHAFVTDDQGVVILAADHGLESRALPGAAVHRMPAEQRMARYLRVQFDTLDMGASSGQGGLLRIAGSPHPHIAARSELPQHGVTVHVLAPIKEIADLRGDAILAFALASFSGILLMALAFGARVYVLGVRRHRKNMEESNETLKTLNEHLDNVSRMDSLTGCANRRHFQERLEAELDRARRYGRDCSIIATDIDFFKKINDSYGHAAGDEALRHFVRVVRGQLRGQDVLGRLGGEEFAALLPETGVTSAAAVAERIRRAIEAAPAKFQESRIPFTASFGIACRTSSAETPDELLRRADHALYAAKSGGRNRVTTATP